MTTLVTGATGHVGNNLIRALLAEGRTVRALTHKTTGPAIAGLNLELIPGDVLKPDSLARAMEGVDSVFHLAACISITGGQAGKVQAVNVAGVRHVAEAALNAGVRRFVHCSSIHAFDLRRANGPIDERSPRAASARSHAYDRSKHEGEIELQKRIKLGLDAVIVNPTGVIGPYDFSPSRMGQVFLDLHRGRFPALVAGGFDWVDARDVAQGMLAAEKLGRTGENYILACHFASLVELAAAVHRVTNVATPQMATPLVLARLGVPFARTWASLTGKEPLFTQEALDALAPQARVDRSKARRVLQYFPRPLENTIRDLYDWFFENGAL